MDIRRLTGGIFAAISATALWALVVYLQVPAGRTALQYAGITPWNDAVFFVLVPLTVAAIFAVWLLHREVGMPRLLWIGVILVVASFPVGLLLLALWPSLVVHWSLWQMILAVGLAAAAVGLEAGGEVGQVAPRLLLAASAVVLLDLIGDVEAMVSLFAHNTVERAIPEWVGRIGVAMLATSFAALSWSLLRPDAAQAPSDEPKAVEG